MPEGAFPFRWGDRRTQVLLDAVRSQQIAAWFGTFMPYTRAENPAITQSLVSLTPAGTMESQYNKVKLVPLGEYIPLRSVIGKLIKRLSPIQTVLIPGQADQRFETPWGRAAIGVCFDSIFPELFRIQVAGGGEFILTVSNDDPFSSRMMLQHHAHDVMRAIESDRWTARATNTGYSGIVNPHGQTQWISGRLTYETHLHQIYRRQTKTLYVRWGDRLLLFLIVLSSAGFITFRKRRQNVG